jgi:fumarate hydratase class II
MSVTEDDFQSPLSAGGDPVGGKKPVHPNDHVNSAICRPWWTR